MSSGEEGKMFEIYVPVHVSLTLHVGNTNIKSCTVNVLHLVAFLALWDIRLAYWKFT